MADSYPYIISNNKVAPIFEKIKSAAKPLKFTHELLKKMGFVSSNDRAMVSILKGLGFLTDDGSPTEYYDRLKDPKDHPYVIGERVKDLYSELFALDTDINNADDDEIKGAFARITGKDSLLVQRYTNTFKALCSVAKFDASPSINEPKKDIFEDETKQKGEEERSPLGTELKPDFHYNIQIHLPATTDISVYNAIFKSLKENLLV